MLNGAIAFYPLPYSPVPYPPLFPLPPLLLPLFLATPSLLKQS